MPNIKDHSPDEFLAAFLEDSGNAPLALYAGAALDAAGRKDEALCVWTIGDDTNPVLRTIHRHPEAKEDLKAHSLRADTAIREHFTTLHHNTVDAFEKTLKTGNVDRIRAAIWTQFPTDSFEFRVRDQRPMTFYIPDLPARPVTPKEMLPWIDAIEAEYPTILAEYQSAVQKNVTQYPYVPEGMGSEYWAPLRGKLDWAALYLYFNAQKTEEAEHFPKTLEAVSKTPLLTKNGAAMEMFFSRLRPGTHIPPHYGLTNSRLTVHLPLIVPKGCEIRVGSDVHQWEEGKIIAFDDSYEHEAWNRGDGDRTVLIFETHHPDLSPTEIEAIGWVYAAFDSWVEGRADKIGLVLEDPNDAKSTAGDSA